MITYWVKYKLPNQWFWRKIDNIKEDGIVEETGQRWFFDKYNKRIEIPNTCLFIFSELRHELILDITEKNKAGIPTGMSPH